MIHFHIYFAQNMRPFHFVRFIIEFDQIFRAKTTESIVIAVQFHFPCDLAAAETTTQFLSIGADLFTVEMFDVCDSLTCVHRQM